MSAAWDGSIAKYQPEARQNRMLRMWAYSTIGIVFYIFVQIRMGF